MGFAFVFEDGLNVEIAYRQGEPVKIGMAMLDVRGTVVIVVE